MRPVGKHLHPRHGKQGQRAQEGRELGDSPSPKPDQKGKLHMLHRHGCAVKNATPPRPKQHGGLPLPVGQYFVALRAPRSPQPGELSTAPPAPTSEQWLAGWRATDEACGGKTSVTPAHALRVRSKVEGHGPARCPSSPGERFQRLGLAFAHLGPSRVRPSVRTAGSRRFSGSFTAQSGIRGDLLEL
ncbi:hypothetical protein AAFF_G00206500 [Aldrovandia affinis]|uniref:Uncharacterized protein n=1 Tax=Aldrovandia affinis TaxID=143900 RepID=A0AAD7RH98_9TELE|nr:hypothetical protein AAFF_G00206500 [Aldrovandia affinis]